ncbi:hypothetical protein [Nonomuraea typhae]|uniref:hypothetical protein n=1 Tax=Nonomuraea typhae TaxID=2603600 RepID=UPI0012FADF9E|nr:hypothetical protein [Nonomuraea typhae]
MRNPVFLTINVLATLLTMVVSVLVIADPGFALPAGAEVTAAVDTFARATSIRSLAIGAVLLVLLARGARSGTLALLWVTGLLQAGDAVVHLLNGHPPAAAGAALAVAAFGSAWWLAGH